MTMSGEKLLKNTVYYKLKLTYLHGSTKVFCNIHKTCALKSPSCSDELLFIYLFFITNNEFILML
ncbi:hypothetical protein KUTeg_007045 [Tegillarca granosa]|uniref:Uncharacterized protein n=1 Tax=Tegillarca granosa TaxID=220873 RepID=A0ABQ9FGT7_TEGGR|nr:hypothetical protein KUTeg_007045 [Tegillarca granosa]